MKKTLLTSVLLLAGTTSFIAPAINAQALTAQQFSVVEATLKSTIANYSVTDHFHAGDFQSIARSAVDHPMYTGLSSALMTSVVMARF